MNFQRPNRPDLQSRANAVFDAMRERGTLAADPAIASRRWVAGEALRRLHVRAWQADGESVTTIQTSLAREARVRLADLQHRIGHDGWSILTRVVLEGAAIADCTSLALEYSRQDARVVLLDRLRRALDVVAFDFDELKASAEAELARRAE